MAYDEYKAFGQQRPTHLTVDTVRGEVNLTTGEILDEPPFPDALALLGSGAYTDPAAAWHYRHEGD